MSVSIKLYQTQSPQYISKIYFIQNMCVLNMKQNDRWSGISVCSTGECTQPFLPAISITEVIQNKMEQNKISVTCHISTRFLFVCFVVNQVRNVWQRNFLLKWNDRQMSVSIKLYQTQSTVHISYPWYDGFVKFIKRNLIRESNKWFVMFTY